MKNRISILVAGLFVAAITVFGGSTAFAVGQDAAHQQLINAGITHSSTGNCSDRYNSTCTSYEGIRQGTLDGIIQFKNASPCAVNITGGTEVGHADGTYSHYNGYKVDISRSTCVDNFITGNYTHIGDRGDGATQYQSAAGNIYANEGSHWDITYY